MVDPSEKEQALDAIRGAIIAGAKKFLAAFIRDWPGEQMYGFLFEVPCEGDRVDAVAGSEEGLARVAQRYAAKGYRAKQGDTLALLKTMLRWSSPEDGWYVNYDASVFDKANKLLKEARDKGILETFSFDSTLNRLCLEALQELDRGGAFGPEAARQRVVIGLCYVGGDNSDEEFLGWAEKVNEPASIESLIRELEASYHASELIARPGDRSG